MSSTIVKSIDFHNDHHLNQGGVYLLEKEMKHYWKEQKIELNWDKTKPILSLENTIKFIENTSNILASKDDYFLIKNVSLTSKETHKKLIKENFKRTITSRYGGGVKDKTKTFNQSFVCYATCMTTSRTYLCKHTATCFSWFMTIALTISIRTKTFY